MSVPNIKNISHFIVFLFFKSAHVTILENIINVFIAVLAIIIISQ